MHKTGSIALAAVLFGGTFASTGDGQTPVPPQPIDRMDLESEILNVLDEHGATLTMMAETVVDIRENMATKDHAQAITSNLAAIRAKLDQGVPAPVPAVGSVLSPTVLSDGLAVGPGERIVAINGVPVGSSTVVATPSTVVDVQTSPMQQNVPITTTEIRRPFTRITTSGPSASVDWRGVHTTSNAGCYVDSNGQRQCPNYNPTTVEPGVNNNGTSTRRGLFRWRR